LYTANCAGVSLNRNSLAPPTNNPTKPINNPSKQTNKIYPNPNTFQNITIYTCRGASEAKQSISMFVIGQRK
jgi:hypothetical protein